MVKAVGKIKTVIILWDSLLIMIAVIILAVLMEVEEQHAAQVPTNVNQGKGIVTLILTVLAILNVAKAMGRMTTVILPWDSLLIMIAVMILNVLMEVEEQPVAQAPTNVVKGKGIVTPILNALEV